MRDESFASVAGAEVQCLDPFIGELSPIESVLFHSLAGDVFAKPRYYGFESSDEAAEAFLCYKVRLRTIIRKSRTISGSSEAYIDSCLRFLAKSVRRNRRKKELCDLVLAASGGSLECQVQALSPDLTEEGCPEGGGCFCELPPSWFLERLRSPEKRLLFLSLKCAWEIDDVMAEKVAERVGVPSLWLGGLLHRARASVEGSRECLLRLHERKNALWVKSRLLESQLKDQNLRSEARLRLSRRNNAYQIQYLALQDRISKYKLLVTNKMVAEILKVPKGSVDSGLFYLRTQSLAKKRNCGSA
ncbi:MAG: hypothetical protein NT061_02290 [Spirochaetes bacterium]|nr:hypothetical protein [Spirochaetota bacterium]